MNTSRTRPHTPQLPLRTRRVSQSDGRVKLVSGFTRTPTLALHRSAARAQGTKPDLVSGFTRTLSLFQRRRRVSQCDTGTRLVSGFSLIELVVVIAIMTALLGVTLSTDRSSHKALKQINATYEAALFLREAQVEGTSVVRGGGVSGSLFDSAVGVQLTKASGSMTKFRDTSEVGGIGRRTTGDNDLESKVLRDGATISELCAGPMNNPAADCSGNSLDIAFKRPRLDALIWLTGTQKEAARITVNLGGVTRYIFIYSSGVISVQ